MQRYIVIAMLAGVVQGIIIELPADMLPAGGYIYPNIIEVERTDVRVEWAFLYLLRFAEDITEDASAISGEDEDGILIGLELFFQFFPEVFRGRAFEQIRAEIHSVFLRMMVHACKMYASPACKAIVLYSA